MSKRRKRGYRKVYEDYYGIKIPAGMVIHHIDEDPENNDPKNLLMLPSELHQRYHTCKNAMLAILPHFDGELRRYNQYSFAVLADFAEVLRECQKWMGEQEMLGVRKWIKEGI